MYITIEKLRQREACIAQQALFLRTFPEHEYPNGVEVTLDTCLRHSQDFDFVWAAEKFLPGWALGNFDQEEGEAFAIRVGDVRVDTYPDLQIVRRARCYYFVVVAQLFFEGVAAISEATREAVDAR